VILPGACPAHGPPDAQNGWPTEQIQPAFHIAVSLDPAEEAVLYSLWTPTRQTARLRADRSFSVTARICYLSAGGVSFTGQIAVTSVVVCSTQLVLSY